MVIENPKLRTAFKQRQLANNQHEISGLGYIATEAAYRYGKSWLTELKQVFEKHIDYVIDELHEKTHIRVMKPQGTYLLWLDFSAYPYTDDELHAKIHDQAKLILNRGTDFGKEGTLHARLNVAAPFNLIEEITKRLVDTFHK